MYRKNSNTIDLTGQTFSKLTVIERSFPNDKDNQAMWLCKCQCGGTKIAKSIYLRNGNTKSCGCIRKEIAKQRTDITGKRYGRLLVIERVNRYRNRKGYRWKCQCDCGKITYVIASHLNSGHTQSCGCLHKELLSEKMSSDLIGQRFERLLVISKSDKKKFDKLWWNCICDCGNKKVYSSQNLVGGTHKSCGCLRQETKIKHNMYGTKEYELWTSAQHRAKQNNLPFDIEPQDIIIPTHCPVLGIPLAFNKGRVRFNSATLDKIIPSKGYVRDNITVISLRANSMKGAASLEELEKVVAYIKKNIPNHEPNKARIVF